MVYVTDPETNKALVKMSRSLLPKLKKVHLLRFDNYYYCNKAVGNRIRGLATKNRKLVNCKNCLSWVLKIKLRETKCQRRLKDYEQKSSKERGD